MNERTSTSEGSKKKRLVLGGYYASMQDEDAKKRYLEKLNVTDGINPYETREWNKWKDDGDLWPSITHFNLAMYLLVAPSPYSGNDVLNYKSLDFYRNLLSGWGNNGTVQTAENFRALNGREVSCQSDLKLFKSNGTTESHILIIAQQTCTILSSTDIELFGDIKK